MNKCVAVVVPMYNCESTIENVLKSIESQSYQISEIILVNDGSYDNTSNIVTEYISKSTNIIKHIITKNLGVSHARNIGIKSTECDYIAFCDSDDIWHEKKLENELNVFDLKKDAVLVGTNLNNKHIKRFYHIKFNEITKISVKMQMFKNFFSPSAIIIKRCEFIKIVPTLFPEDQFYAEEGKVFLQLTANNSCYLLNKSFTYTGFGKPDFGHSGLSGNLKEMQKGELRNFKYAYNSKYISCITYCFAYVYSIVKYFRRVIITKLRKTYKFLE